VSTTPPAPSADPTLEAVEKADVATRRLRIGWHPIQLKALTILTERVASPKEIAIALGLTKAKAGHVSWHIRELEKADLVEEVRTEPRRGAVEHFFKARKRPIVTEEEAREWSAEQREEFSRYIIVCISRDFGMAIEYKTLDADQYIARHLTRTPLLLDRRGFEDLLNAYMHLFDRAFEIQAESDERRSRTGEVGLPVSSVLATVPMPMVEPLSTNGGA
jgi:DNA-binding transcriptional ArsR family regulator